MAVARYGKKRRANFRVTTSESRVGSEWRSNVYILLGPHDRLVDWIVDAGRSQDLHVARLQAKTIGRWRAGELERIYVSVRSDEESERESS